MMGCMVVEAYRLLFLEDSEDDNEDFVSIYDTPDLPERPNYQKK